MVYFTPGINYIYLKNYGSKNYEYYIKVEESFKQGTQFTSNGIKYKVTSISSSTSGVCSVVGGSKTNIVIPKTVVYQGATFDVTSIAKNAFKNNKQIKTVKTASYNYLKSIGKEAFKGCKKLNVLNFMWCKNLKKFGKNCFYGISKGADIYVYKRSMYTKLCKTSGVPSGVWIHWMW